MTSTERVCVQITTFSSCLSPLLLQTLLSLTCGYCLIKQVQKEKMIRMRQQEIKCIKKIKSSILFFFPSMCPWFSCCFLVLGYLSESERGKKMQSTWQSIIAPLQNVPSVGQMKRTQAYRAVHAHTHTNTHWHRIVSPWRESKYWVSKSEHSTAQNTSTPCQYFACTGERKGRSTS